MSVWREAKDIADALVFFPRLANRFIPFGQFYHRHIEDVVRFAQPTGSQFAVHGPP
jgi:hypothetical protein